MSKTVAGSQGQQLLAPERRILCNLTGMRVFISAGEASGDAYAAALVAELRKRNAAIEFEGVGGNRLAAEIGSLAADSSHWGAVSIVQSLGVAPRAALGYERAKRVLKRGAPGLFIPIDFGFFNIRLCKIAKRRGWKVLYFVPPGSWRRDKQGRDLPRLTDAIVTPFPWSAEILRGMGANAHFLGHPIKQFIRERRLGVWRDDPAGGAPAARGIPTIPRIAILPGSRSHEIGRNLPMIAEAVRPEWDLEFAVAPNLDPAHVRNLWRGREAAFTQGDVYNVLARSHAALVCSGTATLEAALMRRPHAVIYRVTKGMVRESKLVRFKMPRFISLPNIILGCPLVPELVTLESRPDWIRSALDPLLNDSEERRAQLAGFEEIDALLGPDDAISKTADLALSMLQPDR